MSENTSKPSGKDDDDDDEDPEQESSSKWSLRFLRKYIAKKFSPIKQ